MNLIKTFYFRLTLSKKNTLFKHPVRKNNKTCFKISNVSKYQIHVFLIQNIFQTFTCVISKLSIELSKLEIYRASFWTANIPLRTLPVITY